MIQFDVKKEEIKFNKKSNGFRLPTEAEWEFACKAGTKDIRYGEIDSISWYKENSNARTHDVGQKLPNAFGLYDMSGNVAEWVADVYRPIVDDEFNDFAYYRGNQYEKNAIGEDGSVRIVTVDSIVFDTLSNGKLVATSLPGELYKVGVDEDETYLRTNFDRSDNRNFRDGDLRSSRNFNNSFGSTDSQEETTRKMYNAPKHSVESDSTGIMLREIDQSNDRTSLVNDKTRVYKGGSWKDREYWLDPAQRRYFPQDMATDYIGFRCAMSRVGSKSKEKHKKKN